MILRRTEAVVSRRKLVYSSKTGKSVVRVVERQHKTGNPWWRARFAALAER